MLYRLETEIHDYHNVLGYNIILVCVTKLIMTVHCVSHLLTKAHTELKNKQYTQGEKQEDFDLPAGGGAMYRFNVWFPSGRRTRVGICSITSPQTLKKMQLKQN